MASPAATNLDETSLSQSNSGVNVNRLPSHLWAEAVQILLAPFIITFLLAPLILSRLLSGGQAARLFFIISATIGFAAVFYRITKAKSLDLIISSTLCVLIQYCALLASACDS
jgi:hypothetical protein